jgi:single-strand DNA-binding protein
MQDATVTIGGYVGSDVEFVEGSGTNARALFRVGSTPRWYDRSSGGWRDQETIWITVKAWRGLAHNVKASVRKGEPVIVTGRLRASKWKDQSGEERSRLVVEAVAIGHDLNRGTTAYRRTERTTTPPEDELDDSELVRRLESNQEPGPLVEPGAA